MGKEEGAVRFLFYFNFFLRDLISPENIYFFCFAVLRFDVIPPNKLLLSPPHEILHLRFFFLPSLSFLVDLSCVAGKVRGIFDIRKLRDILSFMKGHRSSDEIDDALWLFARSNTALASRLC